MGGLTMKRKPLTLYEAIAEVAAHYERAKALEYVKNPLGWALYNVWRLVDEVGCRP